MLKSLLEVAQPPTVVFVNIDWKASRHNTVASDDRNMKHLKTTVSSIIWTHNPVVICFCEVGESSNPLTWYQMSTAAAAAQYVPNP